MALVTTKASICAITCAVLLVACGSHQAATSAPVSACQTTPSYSQDIAPLITTYCLGCHDPNSVLFNGFDLTTYNDVDALSANIKASVENNVMPPRSASLALPQNDKSTILQWLACGALNN